MKIIVVAATKTSGDLYVSELIKKYNLESAKTSDFGVYFLLSDCKSSPRKTPFIAIPFNYNETGEQLDTIGRFSNELWLRSHEEITENNISEYFD